MEEVPLRQLESNLVFPFTASGNLGIEDMLPRLYNDTAKQRVISKVRASVGIAPVGAAVIVDILKNGVSIFDSANSGATSRVRILEGQHTATSKPITGTLWSEGDYLTVSIEQVGTSIAGADLTVNVVISE